MTENQVVKIKGESPEYYSWLRECEEFETKFEELTEKLEEAQAKENFDLVEEYTQSLASLHDPYHGKIFEII